MRNITKNTILKCIIILILLFNAILVIIMASKREINNGEIPSIFSSSSRDKYDITEMRKETRKHVLSNELLKIYSDLYDYSRMGYSKPRIRNSSIDYLQKNKSSKICVCSIGKNENLYVKEFVEHYKSLGIDKIFIYDNNDIQGESFETILSDYMKNNFVEIIDVRGLSSIQIPIYNYCYHKNRNDCDWIGFVDMDEFLYIENNETAKNYFFNNRFDKCEIILFNWLMYNDNDLIKYDNRSLKARFPNPHSRFPEVKSFVRGYNEKLLIPTTHVAGIHVYNFCNSNGEKIHINNFFAYGSKNNSKAFIKHYYTKTVEEFCKKIIRGNAHFHRNHSGFMGSVNQKLNFFFKLNKITNEKINILENCLNMKLDKYVNRKI